MNNVIRYFRKWRITPPRLILIGFAFMILTGAILLNLPIASQSGESVGFINALFTATSANCVTGLIVVNTLGHWTIFGKIVILVLIQFGGLGFMTIMTFAMMIFKRQVSLKNRLGIQASFNLEGLGGMVRLVKRVLYITAVFESVGAILLTIGFYFSSSMSMLEALWKGIFHSVSAFCNAGFDIIGAESLTPYQSNTFINFVIMALIISGGLGFIVWIELYEKAKQRKRISLFKRIHSLSLHAKMVLTITAFLIIIGTGLFLVLEWNNPQTLKDMNIWEKIQASLFQSVTLRTAGFNTIDQAGLTDISQFISCILMFIGGASASTAGGIKVVTVGIILFAMLSVFKGRNKIEAYKRTLPLDLLQKALAVVGAMMIVVLASTIILHFTEQGSEFAPSFLDLLFETCSGVGTVGVTTGLTPHLSTAGKLVITVCMFLGRLSPVTVVVALNMKLHANNNSLEYIDERVIIG